MIEEDYIRVAVITGPHGLLGRVKIFIVSDVPDRFSPGISLFLRKGNTYSECAIQEFIPQKGKIALLRLAGVDDRDRAFSLKGSELFIKKSVAENTRSGLLDDDAFYYYDIIGCQVLYRDDVFGEVVDMLEAGAGEVLVIRDRDGRQHMVPFVESMVDTSGIREKILVIHPVEGLIDI